jgi:hypothetical protein
MQRPEQQLINEAGTEVERYIAKLEQNLAISEQQLSITRKLLGIGEACSVPENVQMLISKYLELKSGRCNITEQDYAEQCSAEQTIKQREQLDQFAMAALSSLVSQRNLSCFECAAAAYNYAEAMQAESQKRQGGAV